MSGRLSTAGLTLPARRGTRPAVASISCQWFTIIPENGLFDPTKQKTQTLTRDIGCLPL